MVDVRINGSESNLRSDGLPRVSDLVELIKATIEPGHMITGILLNGRELEEHEWTANVSQLGTAIFEVETGTPEQFVTDRLASASSIIDRCYLEMREARKFFQNGMTQEGNQFLVRAVNTLQAFFEWYGTMMQLVKPDKKPTYDIEGQVKEISEVCKKICEYQLYQSWWALGEAIHKDLEPKLDKLENFFRRFAKAN